LFNDHNIQTFGNQRARDQCSSNSGANDKHVTRNVAFKAWECVHQSVFDRPKWIAAFQIHLFIPFFQRNITRRAQCASEVPHHSNTEDSL
jgi:hypothetical protein